jgi:hypothetical protein
VFDELCGECGGEGLSREFAINEEYTRRIGELVDYARQNPSATSEPAYRMLQILTRLRGEKPAL